MSEQGRVRRWGLALIVIFVTARWISDRFPTPVVLSELALHDVLTRVRAATAPPPPSRDILIVRFDERTLEKLDIPYQQLMDHHATAIRKLLDLGARAVGYDLGISGFQGTAGEAAFLDAVEQSDRVVVASQLRRTGDPAPPTGKRARQALEGRKLRSGFANFDADPATGVLWERGGTRRTASLIARNGQETEASFPARLYLVANGQELDPDGELPGTSPPRVDGRLLIPYRKAGSWPSMPYEELVQPTLPEKVLGNLVRGRIVLVGSYLQAHRDVVSTPLGPLPGVEVQAAILQGLVDPAGVTRVTPLGLELGVMILAGLLLTFLPMRPEARIALGLTVGIGTGLLILVTGLFFQGLWLRFGMLVALILALGIARWELNPGAPPPPLAPGELDLYRSVNLLPGRSIAGADAITSAVVEHTLPRHYTDLRVLGRGGMGVVLAGTDERDGARVAIKVLSPTVADEAALRKRFQREIVALSRLDHPGVLRILEVGPADPLPYFTMELVEGETLRKVFEMEGRLTLPRTRAIFRTVLEALVYLHESQIIHRDIKPENLMVVAGDRVKMLDFGLAHVSNMTNLTQSGQVMGTIRYMSPEQRDEARFVEGTDVFSLCLVIHEALTGTFPFPMRSSLLDFTRPAKLDGPAPGRIPASLESLLARGLDVDESRRPTAREMLASWDSLFGE